MQLNVDHDPSVRGGLVHESRSLLRRPFLALGAPAPHAVQLRIRALRLDRREHDHVAAAVGMRELGRPWMLHFLPGDLLDCTCTAMHYPKTPKPRVENVEFEI